MNILTIDLFYTNLQHIDIDGLGPDFSNQSGPDLAPSFLVLRFRGCRYGPNSVPSFSVL